MLKLGMVGWRGMVGSVLMDRMKQEDDFKFVSTTFFSTSNAGGKAPEVPNSDPILKDADDLDALAACDVVISCQGGDCKNETVALLTYMLQHNEHHAAELDQMADNLKKLNMDAAAKTIKEAVSDFQKGNMRLGLALTFVKEELK